MNRESSSLLEVGRSLPVPNVQELASTISSGNEIPERYIRPELMDTHVTPTSIGDDKLPEIDLKKLLLDPMHPDEKELSKLGFACREWGFIQLINHGIPEEVIKSIKDDMIEFFKLPLKKREEIKQLPGQIEGYGQVCVHSDEQKLDWCDRLALITLPLHKREMRFWPTTPTTFRNSFDRYIFEINKVIGSLFRLMAMDLGVNPDTLHKLYCDQVQVARVSYYPACKQASNLLGLSAHSDAGGLAMLLQVNDVHGLQIKKDDSWYSVRPKPGAFMVTIGDMMEITTNGLYKSVVHRVVVNKDKERLSLSTLNTPSMDTMLYPLPELAGADDGEIYRRINVKEYAREFLSKKMNDKVLLESLKLKK